MPEYQNPSPDYDSNTRIRDLEEKIRLLKDRLLLVGKSVIEHREKSFEENQELKKTVLRLSEENARIKELLERVSEQLNSVPRKEELAILQRQFDLFRS